MYDYLVNEEKSFKFKAIPYPNKMPEYLKLLADKDEIENNLLPALALKNRAIFYANMKTTLTTSLPTLPNNHYAHR